MNILITNANIYTVDPLQPRASAIAIANDRIVAVGSDAEIGAICLPGAQTLDLNGAFVVPGMIDAHLHLMWTGLAMMRVDIFEAPSVSTVVERVRAKAAQMPRDQWIQGHGWMQSLWGGNFPTAANLDAATTDHPVALSAKSGHATWANSLALQRAGITSQTPDPEGGLIVRDADGHPTGVLLENAMGLLAQYIPGPSAELEEQAALLAMEAMNRKGLTGVHCMDGGGGIQSFRAYQRLREQGTARLLRIVKQLPVEELDAVINAGIRSGFGDAWLRIGGIKMFADGALGPRTAAMLAPYEGETDNTGISTFEREALFETVIKANTNGLAAVIHAIGDRANHDVLDAFEVSGQHALREPRAVANGLRNRIEHAQILHPDDIARFARLNVIASVQPIHATQDMLMADKHWGKRSANAYAIRALRDSGAHLAFGSDSPVENFDPLVGMHAAVTRRRADGTPGPAGWYPEQRVSIENAIRAYTIGAAYAGGMEREVGSLEAGKLADLVVLSDDLTRMPADELLSVKVQRVMIDGLWREV
jgi:predicted amidohydrolase YtcJ